MSKTGIYCRVRILKNFCRSHECHFVILYYLCIIMITYNVICKPKTLIAIEYSM